MTTIPVLGVPVKSKCLKGVDSLLSIVQMPAGVPTATFAIGAGLAGVTGALYAPTMTIVPSIGQAFIVSAFITVVTAGASPFVGLVPAAAFLGTVQTTVTFFYKSTIGLIAILCAVILIIRYLPNGFSGLILKKRSK